MEVYVDDEAKLTLHGLQQHYVKIKENEKNRKLFELLDALEFNQVNLSLFSLCLWVFTYLYLYITDADTLYPISVFYILYSHTTKCSWLPSRICKCILV